MAANTELTKEEVDLLTRSTKKAKVDVSGTEGEEEIAVSEPLLEEKVKLGPQEMPSSRPLVSYRDICLGEEKELSDSEMSDSSASSDEGSEEDEQDSSDELQESMEDDGSDSEEETQRPTRPVVKVTKEERKQACQPWKHSIIIKLLGKKVTMKFLWLRLEKLWHPLGEMELIDLENEYFLVRFSNFNDVSHVFEGGPWMILGHYLVIQKWHPEIFPFEDELRRVAVWIRIPSLPIEYYDRTILSRIGDSLGKTVRVDSNTLKPKNGVWDETVTERGKFARLSIEVDLKQPLISSFELLGRSYTVEYEGLHLICFNCGMFGHRKDECPSISVKDPIVSSESNGEVRQQQNVVSSFSQHDGKEGTGNEVYGPWMMVQRPGRKKQGGGARVPKGDSVSVRSGGKGGNDNFVATGSRFAALGNFEKVDELVEKQKIPHGVEGRGSAVDASVEIQHGGGKAQKGAPSEVVVPQSEPSGSGPVSLVKIKRDARSQGQGLSQENSQVLDNSKVTVLPVAQPIFIPTANLDPPFISLKGGVCNLRPPDAASSKCNESLGQDCQGSVDDPMICGNNGGSAILCTADD
ncbi:Zinc finger, CCHC-type [Sesbania bispinosa]|nr:Zinc finger, CCHC-type [Sesbania bispinosa]